MIKQVNFLFYCHLFWLQRLAVLCITNIMINKELLNPGSIVVVGGSNDVRKPGGKVLKNLIDGGYKGKLYVTNLKEDTVQGLKAYRYIEDLPPADLAIIAVAAQSCPAVIGTLANQHNTRAFIIISAGFSEASEEGKKKEDEIVAMVNNVKGSLIGPNCIGVLTPNYHGLFTEPVPRLDPKGCDFISGSGAAACFILESGIPNGLTFASIFSIGNSAQTGVEEILKYFDETFDPEKSSPVKLLYIETLKNPGIFLKHASSLVKKGCRIAAIKAGSSEAGSRAASSHTGALASPDLAVEALFRKAGIVRCHSRQELITVASIFMYPELKGENIAVITHAGGPAVMLTDALSKNGLVVPLIDNQYSPLLLDELYPGSSVSNPIDFLSTGTAEQIKTIINYVDNKFDEIDGMIVIFGTPGLVEIYDTYEVLHEQMKIARKPIFPVLPSIMTAKNETEFFLSKGHINFPDEVVLSKALGKTYNRPKPAPEKNEIPEVDRPKIRQVIDSASTGYISPEKIQKILDAAGIPRVNVEIASTNEDALLLAGETGYPLAIKVVGPLHKSDVGGVVLNVKSDKEVMLEFERLMKIKGATSVLIQPMLSGIELFAGVKYENKFGHLILCGLGGIYVEAIEDIKAGLAPLSKEETLAMIRSLKSYKIIKGTRGQKGVNDEKFVDILVKLSALVDAAPEITELDLNPIFAKDDEVIAVDARIRVEKQSIQFQET